MPERYVSISDFDPGAIRETLEADSRGVRDVAHGDGEAFTLGRQGTELEVYPGAGVARVTTESARVELFRVPGYRLSEANHVIFELSNEQDRLRLLVGSEGHISLRPLLRATGSPITRQTSPDGHQDRMSPVRASQAVTAPPPVDHPVAAESEQREQVTITDRVGGDRIWTKTDGDATARVFLFAHNHTDGEPPTWYHVHTRGEVADQVQVGARQGWLRKRKYVTVTGYPGEPITPRSKTLTFEATSVTRARAAKPLPGRDHAQ